MTGGGPARFDSWYGAVWTIVIALDFFWLSNPLVFTTFDRSLHFACLSTLAGLVLTLPRLRLPRPSWAVAAVVAFGFVSALWSADASLTVDFTVIYLVIAVLGTVVVAQVDGRAVTQGLTLGGVLVIVLSIYAFRQAMPGADVPPGGDGYLAGVGTNRNILSYTLLIALPFAATFLPRTWWGRVPWALALGSVLLGLYLAQSGTGYIAATVVLCSAAAMALLDRRRLAGSVRAARPRWVGPLIAAVVIAGAIGGFELFGRIIGRDTSTLSGRVPLWQSIWEEVTGGDRWIGAGWGSVWPHPWKPAATNDLYANIIDRAGIVLSHGHNSFFDLLPEVGLVGAALYALTYVQAVRLGSRLRDPRQVPQAARLEVSRTTLVGVLGLVLFGLTEPISTIPLGWFVIVLLATGLGPRRTPSRRGRRRRRAREAERSVSRARRPRRAPRPPAGPC